MASLSVVVLAILELGSPFILLNMGMFFHEAIPAILFALLGQLFPRSHRLSKRLLASFLALSGLLLVLQHSGILSVLRLTILCFAVFSCSASLCYSYLGDESPVPETEKKIMRIIGYGLSVSIVLSPSYIFLLAYFIAAAGLYKYNVTPGKEPLSSKTTLAILKTNTEYIAEGIFSYSALLLICYRGAMLFKELSSMDGIFGYLSLMVPGKILVPYASELLASVTFAIYRAASDFGVLPYSEESPRRKPMIAGLLALSIFVQMRSIPVATSVLVFILSGFLFREYISQKDSEDSSSARNEAFYARHFGLIIAFSALTFTGGNFSVAMAISAAAVVLSLFLKA